jgi:toxin ParE1/3/4
VRELIYSHAAKEDLLAIMEYISNESGSVEVGLGFTKQLRQQCSKLANLPGILGRARPELRPDIRSFAFKGYVIFCRYLPDTFEVVNIIEGHRDVDRYFSDYRS